MTRMLAALVLALTVLVAPAAAQKRVALVVGNGSYGATLGALANPVRDARLVEAALRRAGFDVDTVLDADQRTLKQAISRLGRRLDAAGVDATGLFYYAGHGVQSRGENYLIPVNAALASEADLELDAVDAEAVLRQMQDARAATSIVVLDACRNMPLTRSFRSGARGLARIDAPNGSYVAYSTAPGQTAADGTGANSAFAIAFAQEIAQPNLPIDTVFTNVRRTVAKATGGEQTPWSSSSLLDTFVFTSGPANFAPPPRPAAAPVAAALAPEVARLTRECDRLAAHPLDQRLPSGIAGVENDVMLPVLAVPTCEAAQRAAPGNTRVTYNLGRAYGVQGSFDRARQLYEQAAAAGSARAMSDLGFLYEQGLGVALDYAIARRWYEQAAAGGDAGAMFNLGNQYRDGLGVPQDYAAARRWWEQAMAKGYGGAMTNIGWLFDRGLGTPQNYVTARGWYEKAAAKGDPVAMNNLGMLYRDGLGVKKDYAVARRWFEQAAVKGNASGLGSLGWLYDNGNGVAQDFAAARRWYEQAAAKNDTTAMLNLGVLYENGRGVTRDLAAARQWYQRASAAGDARAAEALAKLPQR